MTLRILEVITPSRLGGAERYVGWMSQELMRRGHDVLIGIRQCEQVESFYKELGVPTSPLRISGKFNPLAKSRVKKLIESFKPDVVHTHLSTASHWGLRAAKEMGIPGVGHMHSFNSIGPYANATRMIAVSNAVKNHLVEKGFPSAHVNVVYPSSIIDNSEPAHDILALGDPVVSCAARLREDKGIGVLLEAFSEVQKRMPRASLVLCGDGPMRSEIEASKPLGVHCMGYRSDVPAVFAASTLSVLPSIRPEGYGMALSESQAVGTPVITTAAGGTEEAMIDGVTGIVVPPSSAQDMAKAIISIAENREKRREMANAAKTFAETRTIEASADELLKTFDSLAPAS